MTRVLAVDGSPRGGGRTAAVLEAVLRGAREAGAQTTTVGLAGGDDAVTAAVAAAEDADTFVFGAPTYRAAPAAPLKAFLDLLPRGTWGETTAPITARPVGIVLTGATDHHHLALGPLRDILAGFFAAHVLSPGLYVAGSAFADGRPDAATVEVAGALGRTLVALAAVVDATPALRAVRPQV